MTMAMRRSDRLMVAVHDEAPPTDEEWSRWVELAFDPPTRVLRVLVETRGHGGPNPKQRKHFADGLKRVDLRCAILSDSMIVRGVVTAVAWLGVALRAFAPGQHVAAADYLELSHTELERALALLVELRRECGVRGPKSDADELARRN
jgi:hypothetical protein